MFLRYSSVLTHHLYVAVVLLASVHAVGAQEVHLSQHSIFFGGGSAYIDVEERSRVDAFLKQIPALHHYGIQLQGHTDDIGSEEYNLRLAAARTQAVKRLLLEFAVEEGAIEMLPLGEGAPVFDNATWEGKLNNRRVDLILKAML